MNASKPEVGQTYRGNESGTVFVLKDRASKPSGSSHYAETIPGWEVELRSGGRSWISDWQLTHCTFTGEQS